MGVTRNREIHDLYIFCHQQFSCFLEFTMNVIYEFVCLYILYIFCLNNLLGFLTSKELHVSEAEIFKLCHWRGKYKVLFIYYRKTHRKVPNVLHQNEISHVTRMNLSTQRSCKCYEFAKISPISQWYSRHIHCTIISSYGRQLKKREEKKSISLSPHRNREEYEEQTQRRWKEKIFLI